MFQFALVFGPVVGIILIIIEYPLIMMIPVVWGVLKLIGGLSFYFWDKKKKKDLPALPCDGHKGTWSNPKYFTEEELNSKE